MRVFVELASGFHLGWLWTWRFHLDLHRGSTIVDIEVALGLAWRFHFGWHGGFDWVGIEVFIVLASRLRL